LGDQGHEDERSASPSIALPATDLGVLALSARHWSQTVTSLPEDPSSLISEDDRDTAVQRLSEAYAEGHISHEEMNERLHQVLTAKTHSQLVPALASLPEKNAGTMSTIAAAGGRIKRRGAWRVSRILKVESAYGRVHLDLSCAVIEHPVVDIQLQFGTGRAKITVPRDAIVDFEELRTGWKDTLLQAPTPLPVRRADDPDLRDDGVRTVEDPPRSALSPRPAPAPPVRHFFVPARLRKRAVSPGCRPGLRGTGRARPAGRRG
jgi:hypothetical protein